MGSVRKNGGLYVNPMTDYGFKLIFGDEVVMMAFLNDLLEPVSPIVSVEFVSQEVLPEVESVRGVVYDVRCRTSDGQEFIVEMQNRPQTHLPERVVLYLSRAVSTQRRRGADVVYEDGCEKRVEWDFSLRPVYCIFFLNFRVRNEAPQAVRTVRLRVDETNEVFSDAISAYILELPDYRGKSEGDCQTKIDSWLYNLANMNSMDTREIPFSNKQPAFKRMFNIAEIAKMSPDEAARYDISFESWWVANDTYNTAQREGMEHGIAEGRAEGRRDANVAVVLNMFRRGLSEGDIASYSGIDLEQVREILLSHRPHES